MHHDAKTTERWRRRVDVLPSVLLMFSTFSSLSLPLPLLATRSIHQAREADRRRQAAERKLSEVTSGLKKLQVECWCGIVSGQGCALLVCLDDERMVFAVADVEQAGCRT